MMAAEEGVDIVDCAFASMAGLTSQPSLNALVEALRFTERDTGMSFEELQTTANYWDEVRKNYAAFETGQRAASAEVYLHEMPGGQYANLYQQAQSLGVANRWKDVGKTYAAVNRMFGDIVKVTPSSKVVGDMALFMLANDLTAEQVIDPKRELAFPESVVEFFEGRLGQPPGGLPEALQKKVLRGRAPLTHRPGVTLPPVDFAAVGGDLEKKLGRKSTEHDISSYLMYPKVFVDFIEHQKRYSDTSVLPTHTFFNGMDPGEEINIEIEPGKTLIIKYLTLGDAHEGGSRQVYFELNGQPRDVQVVDHSLAAESEGRRLKAEPGNPLHVAAPMPGAVTAVIVGVGEEVAAGQKLVTLEAMKMETTLYSERPGRIAEVIARPHTHVEAGDLLLRFEK
jgi:pyruvate carboxylase